MGGREARPGTAPVGHRVGVVPYDPISFGGTLAAAMELFEMGVLSEKDTDGIALRFGKAEALTVGAEMLRDATAPPRGMEGVFVAPAPGAPPETATAPAATAPAGATPRSPAAIGPTPRRATGPQHRSGT